MLRRILFHLFVALLPLYSIGEGYNYKWGIFAAALCLAYSLWTYETGYKHGFRTAHRIHTNRALTPSEVGQRRWWGWLWSGRNKL